MASKPIPFPVRASSVLALDNLTGWAGTGDWIASGGDVLIDGWGGVDSIQLFSQMLFYWGNNPEVEQEPFQRSTMLTKVFTGLPANTFVRIVSNVSWNYMDFGASGKPIGMYVNGVLFRPNTTPSGTFGANNGQCIGYGTINSLGELTIAFGTENINPSYDILIAFDDVEISLPAAEFEDIIVDSAYAWTAGNPTSITRGSLTFDAQEEWKNYTFPGKTMPVVGLDEVVRSRPVVRGNMMMTGERQFEIYRPGGTWADSASAGGQSAAGIRTYTPGAFRSTLSLGAYLPRFIVIWKRLRGDYVAVEFSYALCTKFGIGSLDADEGQIPVEFEARQDLSSETSPKSAIPYLVHILPPSFQFAA